MQEIHWVKATASNPTGNCVEVAHLPAGWVKASASAVNACVAVKRLDGAVGVRDSKDRDGQVLMFTTEEWAAFLDGAKKGEFDFLSR